MGGAVDGGVGGFREVAFAACAADAVVVGGDGVVVEVIEAVPGGAVPGEEGVGDLDCGDGDAQEPECTDQANDRIKQQAVRIGFLLDRPSHPTNPTEQ